MNVSKNILEYINSINEVERDPYYVYNTKKIKNQCAIFQNISYQHKSIHFASMANANPHFLEIIKNEKVSIFVNSILHLSAALEAGFQGQEIIYTASALSVKTMKYIEALDVQLNVDSPGQLKQWQNLFPDKSIGIRCNIGDAVKPCSTHAGYFIGKDSRLGFTREEIQQISDKSKIKGLHLYVGTEIFDIDYFINCYKELIDISSDFSDLEYLNFGGGFGVSEDGETQFNFTEYDVRVTELINQFSLQKGKSIRLILEPGRIIGGEAGYFVCIVTDVKPRAGKQLVGVNASTVQFPRPLLYPDVARHPIGIIRNGVQLKSDKPIRTTIFGCSTYSRDIFSNHAELPELKIGDTILFGNAGSYSASSHMQFLGFPKPEEFFI
jgi:diaminopimelate decarboxylase